MLSTFLWVNDKSDLEKCFYIRKKVFIEEQGFNNDLDDIDNTAYHLLLLDCDSPVATARLFIDKSNFWRIGRVCVLKNYRKNNIGAFLIKECIKKATKLKGNIPIILSAQVGVQKFYEKLGFYSYGDIFYEDNCPHIMMKYE